MLGDSAWCLGLFWVSVSHCLQVNNTYIRILITLLTSFNCLSNYTCSPLLPKVKFSCSVWWEVMGGGGEQTNGGTQLLQTNLQLLMEMKVVVVEGLGEGEAAWMNRSAHWQQCRRPAPSQNAGLCAAVGDRRNGWRWQQSHASPQSPESCPESTRSDQVAEDAPCCLVICLHPAAE